MTENQRRLRASNKKINHILLLADEIINKLEYEVSN